jgi:phosphatidylinositol glycan class Q protein
VLARLWILETRLTTPDCLSLVQPYLPILIRFIGFSAFAGATMPISLFSDLVSLLTLHIYSFYIASARIFHWQLTIIISLFHLFRGKKRNILRNRIDSCDYDLDQLLLGTILFTLQFFLLPTVFVFYLTFASARMAVIGVKAALEIGLACLNHFPLFAVMLRLKDSRRLPGTFLSAMSSRTLTPPTGGICFELHDPKSLGVKDLPNSAPTAYILLKVSRPLPIHVHASGLSNPLQSVPLPLRAMFQSYFELGNRIRKHYFSPSVFMYLASGQFVPPIHRRNLYSLQYSMLPANRVSIGEIWKKLSQQDEDAAHAPNGRGAMSSRRWMMDGQRRRSRK